MSTIAVALAGGGPLGGIYEIGACAALADSIKGVRFEQADIYVGVSSGAVIASALANGISPDKLVRILLSDDSGEFFDPSTLLRPPSGSILSGSPRCRRWRWRVWPTTSPPLGTRACSAHCRGCPRRSPPACSTAAEWTAS